jgi:NAD(P)-dependent dehydrogenase (short-subunit alcohol dehydrogenase family)
MELEGRIALVTGGGSGIGVAIAKRFAAAGATVVVADIARDRADRVARESGEAAFAYAFDVADPGAVATAMDDVVETVGAIDILVNNAGISMGNDILTIDPETWDRNLAIVLKGPYLCSRAVIPGMISKHRGAIVNIASVNGMSGLGEEPYSAAKAGLLNFTQNLAMRYGRDGIRVNAISPGTVRTPIWSERLKTDPDAFDRLASWYPLGRVGEPDDVAEAALFLASDRAAWITGVNLPVDGGLTAGRFRMQMDLQGEGKD